MTPTTTKSSRSSATKAQGSRTLQLVGVVASAILISCAIGLRSLFRWYYDDEDISYSDMWSIIAKEQIFRNKKVSPDESVNAVFVPVDPGGVQTSVTSRGVEDFSATQYQLRRCVLPLELVQSSSQERKECILFSGENQITQDIESGVSPQLEENDSSMGASANKGDNSDSDNSAYEYFASLNRTLHGDMPASSNIWGLSSESDDSDEMGEGDLSHKINAEPIDEFRSAVTTDPDGIDVENLRSIWQDMLSK